MDGILKEAPQVPQEQDPLARGILQLKQKNMPNFKTDSSTFAYQSHKQLYKFLQIFDFPDEDTDKQVQYIWNFLSEDGGDPRDKIVKLNTKLGAVRFGETMIDRIYKYCRLRSEARRALGQYENLQRDMAALGTKPDVAGKGAESGLNKEI